MQSGSYAGAMRGFNVGGKCYGLHPYRSLGVLRRQPANRPVTDVSGTARNETLASISGGRARTTGDV
jgi:hypothetical protein